MKKLTTKELNNLNKKKPIDKLLNIIKILRDPNQGCPWDIKQDYLSLSQYPIEESYELQNAIQNNDIENIKEELGDLLLQVLLFSQIGKDNNDFDFNIIADILSKKLIRRHPQIFDKNYKKNDFPQDTWEKIKKKEKLKKDLKKFNSILSDVPKNLPPLIRSFKIQNKASLLNFDWNNYQDVLKKVDEELDELKEALDKPKDLNKIEEELGDLFFTMISLSRHLKLNPDNVLQKSIKKFENRFLYLEKKIYDKKLISNKKILEYLWLEAKSK